MNKKIFVLVSQIATPNFTIAATAATSSKYEPRVEEPMNQKMQSSNYDNRKQ